MVYVADQNHCRADIGDTVLFPEPVYFHLSCRDGCETGKGVACTAFLNFRIFDSDIGVRAYSLGLLAVDEHRVFHRILPSPVLVRKHALRDACPYQSGIFA